MPPLVVNRHVLGQGAEFSFPVSIFARNAAGPDLPGIAIALPFA